MLVSIIDYKMGNILSIKNAIEYLGGNVIVTDDEEHIRKSDKIILPGVGSFKKAMDNIKSKSIDKILEDEIFSKKKPILGICLGMQLFFNSSEEDGLTDGFALLKGDVQHLSSKLKKNEKIPQIGFDSINIVKESSLFKGIDDFADFYFAHSYSVHNAKKDNITSLHNDNIIASVEEDNIYGVQFHPEKSQDNGLMLLANFLNT